MELDKYDKHLHKKVIPAIDLIIHILLIFLIIGLLLVICIELYKLFMLLFTNQSVEDIIGTILFTFILVELFSILHSYLKNHYIKVTRVVEVGIISVVRELIFKLFEIDVAQIYAFSTLLVAFGVIFWIEKHFGKSREGD